MMRPTAITRRHCAVAISLILGGVAAVAAPVTLPVAIALSVELSNAVKGGQPLVVMVSLEGCPFCKIVRENYLGPMRERGELTVVQVDMRSKQQITDLRGNSMTHDELVRAWGVKVAPTLLFFGRSGTEVAERLVGGSIPDFYGAYLEERLVTARSSLAKKP